MPAYEERSYQDHKPVYDLINQAYTNVHIALHSQWKPFRDLQGMTMRFVGVNQIEISHHRHETGYNQILHRIMDKPNTEIQALEAELKKELDALSDGKISLRRVGVKRGLDKVTRLNDSLGRYLIRDRYLYEFDL